MEQLRSKMVETALLRQSFLHREVITLSQRLDEMIIRVQREQAALSRAN
ncbi:aspartyl-phosphate phosphatase Spo0E family protein [Paenibacillus sp. 2TAB19]